MKIDEIAVERVKPYAQNPRNNKAAISKVADSIREFGFRQPIVVDKHFVVVVGHTRLEAAKLLGMRTVPVHVAKDLTAVQARAYRLADNRLNEDAEWDEALLGAELKQLADAGFGLALTGFGDDELSRLLAAHAFEGIVGDPDEDDVIPRPDPVTREGDVIQLGHHRLICGDSRSETVWSTLMGGQKAGLCWTDPPYGVKVVGGTKEKLTIKNDDLAPAALEVFLAGALGLAYKHSKPGASWYVAAPGGPLFMPFGAVLLRLGVWRQTIIWAKDQFVLGRSDYHYKHEVVFHGEQPEAQPNLSDEKEVVNLLYGWREGAPHEYYGGRKQSTVWEVPRPKRNPDHPTMKPLGLIVRALENSSKPGTVVIDPFGGSGSTLLACQATGRVARLIELDPAYCDVIVRRWEEHTGQKAVRESRANAA